MKYTIIKLKNLSPLHLGTGKDNYDFSSSMLQSDTISSALASMRAWTGKCNDVKEFLESFTVSSAFPYYKDIFFLPAPSFHLNVNVHSDNDNYVYQKKLKKIQFIDAQIWPSVINRMPLEIDFDQIHGEFLLDKENRNNFTSNDKIKTTQLIERVSIPNQGLEAIPFYFSWDFFQSNSGLYCLLQASEETKDEIISLFRLLGKNGIGTDKSVGGGLFDIETGELDIPNTSDGNQQILLSTYLPSQNELMSINLKESYYDLLLRGGFMNGSEREELRHLRKKSVYMFAPGSILNTTQLLSGQVIDLKPNWNKEIHPVFRSGKPFYITIK